MNQVEKTLGLSQGVTSGDTILLIYDIVVLLLFVFEMFLYFERRRVSEEEGNLIERAKNLPKLKRQLLKVSHFYNRHGYLVVGGLLLVLTLIAVAGGHRMSAWEFFFIVGSFALFSVVVYFIQRLFMGLDRFKNVVVSKYVRVIFYLLFGHYFVYFFPMITLPDLFLTFTGLTCALLLCYGVMIRAIINPNILMKHTHRLRLKENAPGVGIIKGMMAIIACELGSLYLMLYACFKTDPTYFVQTAGEKLDALDLIYYLFVTFSTIGYGDIHPARVDGLFYAKYAVIVIAVTSIFSTACFIGAVVSGAANAGQITEETDRGES